jgi:alpha/beta superfamily hydrolase
MNTTSIVEEKLRLGRDERLAGVLAYPADREPDFAVLLCSPHPNFAGDMENNVIVALAESLSGRAVTLRFDYRGIGESRIDLTEGLSVFDYWENVEQKLDYTDALADAIDAADELSSIAGTMSCAAVGYSFGAVIATQLAFLHSRFGCMVGIAPPLTRVAFLHLSPCPKSCLMLSGENDFVHDATVAKCLVNSAGPRLNFQRMAGADHFFRGHESNMAERVARFVCENLKSKAAIESIRHNLVLNTAAG